jgi:hypothetical protein
MTEPTTGGKGGAVPNQTTSSTDGVHREACGCEFDGFTGLLLKQCGEHAPKSESITGIASEFMARHDRLLVAALPAADHLKTAHGEKHVGDFQTCRDVACIETRTLIAAIRESWPAEAPKVEQDTEEIYPLSRGDA